MKSKSEILSLMWKLGVICVVVAGLLAFVNGITAPVIEENNIKNEKIAMREVLSGAENFEKKDIDFTPSESGVEVVSVYQAEDKGYVVTSVCKEGYGGDITVIVGINPDMTVNKAKIMTIAETAGLGMKADSEEFLNQYAGLKKGIGVEKNNGGNPENNTISAISGATKTSAAVTKAINCALEVAHAGGGGNE